MREELSGSSGCILSVAALLQAGYAVEMLYMESDRIWYCVWGGRAVCRELNYIKRGLKINIVLENC